MFIDAPVKLTEQGQHPFLWALDRAKSIFNMSQSDIARHLQVLPQTIAIWKRYASEDQHYLLPAEQVPALCVLLMVKPKVFRPDLWPSDDWTFDETMPIYIRVKDYARSEVPE